MRLLIVNPNTSEGVTARIRAAAEAVTQPGDRFTTVSAAFGPHLIVTENDASAATEGVLAAVARHHEKIDGIVLASFGDTGAERLRLRYPEIPVLGIAEASFLAVRQIGGRFAIVTFAPEVVPSLRMMAERHRMTDHLLHISAVPRPLSHNPSEVADLLFDDLRELCRSAVSEGTSCIILGGGPLAGLAGRLGHSCPVPLIDGTQAAISQLRGLGDANMPPMSQRSFKG
jgi:allantoin racemase